MPVKNPDHDIEQFWINFKQSMINFYDEQRHQPIRRIAEWSANLNVLQENKQYNMIEVKIKNYMSLYGLDVLKAGNPYYLNILVTNIKRWNKLVQEFGLLDSEKNLIIVLIEVAFSLYKSDTCDHMAIKNLFADIELVILYEDFGEFIEFAISNDKPNILDKLIAYNPHPVLNYLKNTYGELLGQLTISTIPAGKKLLSTIKNTNINGENEKK